MSSLRLFPARAVTARAGALAAWSNSWLAGSVGSDDVLDAVGPAIVTGDESADSLAAVLIQWRRRGVRRCLLRLPAPGDVRGVPGPAATRTAALDAGTVIVAGDGALIPVGTDAWTLWPAQPAPADPIPLRDAERELLGAMRAAADEFSRLGPSRWHEATADGLVTARAAGDVLALPPDHPPAAVRLVALAQRVGATLDLAAAAKSDGSIDAVTSRRRADTLRQLATASRRALAAAYTG